jgi:hypothetical protein
MAGVAHLDGAPRGGGVNRSGFRSPGIATMVSMEWLKLLKRPMTGIIFLFLVPGTAGIMALSYLSVRLSGMNAADRAANLQGVLLPGGHYAEY